MRNERNVVLFHVGKNHYMWSNLEEDNFDRASVGPDIIMSTDSSHDLFARIHDECGCTPLDGDDCTLAFSGVSAHTTGNVCIYAHDICDTVSYINFTLS